MLCGYIAIGLLGSYTSLAVQNSALSVHVENNVRKGLRSHERFKCVCIFLVHSLLPIFLPTNSMVKYKNNMQGHYNGSKESSVKVFIIISNHA